MDTKTAETKDEVLVARDGAIVTLTFNRPEARNAMTWGMYQRLYEVCEEVDADDSLRASYGFARRGVLRRPALLGIPPPRTG